MKKILVISYTFPPSPGIGGRRWAKFSKELIAAGHDVRVMTFVTAHESAATSEWVNDIVSFKDKIEYYPSHYPKWLVAPSSFKGKIMYRLSLLYVKLFSKGNYYDRASFLRHTVVKRTQDHIDRGYNNVIVTCAPFKLSYWVSELIVANPLVNFIVDFRDPWTNNLTAYGWNEMSRKRIDYELKAEEAVITKFNKIIVVANEMKDYFVAKYNIPREKIEVINNGFDEDDFVNVPDSEFVTYFNRDGRKKVAFTGTFYNNSLYLLKELSSVLKEDPELSSSIEFHFFGSMPDEGVTIVSNSQNLFFHGNVKLDKVYRIIRSADYCSIFLTDDINYSLSTKFLEYISQKKKILVFSGGGSTGTFVENYGLGCSIISKYMREKLTAFLESIKTEKEEINFPIEDYNIKNLTKDICRLLK